MTESSILTKHNSVMISKSNHTHREICSLKYFCKLTLREECRLQDIY